MSDSDQMSLVEWREIVMSEVRGAGFEVSEFHGWPLVKTPESFDDKYKFLKLRFTVPAVRTIYSEGVLITPRPL